MPKLWERWCGSESAKSQKSDSEDESCQLSYAFSGDQIDVAMVELWADCSEDNNGRGMAWLRDG
jgi:hypothetical protein